MHKRLRPPSGFLEDKRVRSKDAMHYFDLCRYVIGLRLSGHSVPLIAAITMAKQKTVKEILRWHGKVWHRARSSLWTGGYTITEQTRALFSLDPAIFPLEIDHARGPQTDSLDSFELPEPDWRPLDDAGFYKWREAFLRATTAD